MGAGRELGSGCSKRTWQQVQQEALVVSATTGLDSGCSKRAW